MEIPAGVSFFYANNEPKSALARDLGDCRDNKGKPAKRVFTRFPNICSIENTCNSGSFKCIIGKADYETWPEQLCSGHENKNETAAGKCSLPQFMTYNWRSLHGESTV